jgi:hypothetical protein
MYKVYFIKFESNLKLKIMKKLILTLLLTSLASYSQTVDLNLTLNNIIPINMEQYYSENNFLTVPENKIWVIQTPDTPFSSDYTVSCLQVLPLGFSSYQKFFPLASSNVTNNRNGNAYNIYSGYPMYLTEGTRIYSPTSSNTLTYCNILEFNAPSTQTGTLALNDIIDVDKKIELFPNPTNSKIALNSEKNYNIEIYDMKGNIVMKDKGNSIDLSNLSKAVYILKAYDNLEKTSTTYKVVKN